MNDEQLLRYSRQIMLPDFDYPRQQRLLDARVLIVGLGGLGCPVALYLAAAGVGELWLADYDVVELSNLQRQVAHGVEDIGRAKVDSAADAIRALNPDVTLRCIDEKLQDTLLLDTVSQVDLVVDASDNFATRFALNRACVTAGKPLVSGAAIRAEGQVICFDSRRSDSPCYRCLYSDDSGDEQLSCSQSGVLAPLVGMIGTVQAMQALKILAQFGELRWGELLVLDARAMSWRSLKVSRDSACPVCGDV